PARRARRLGHLPPSGQFRRVGASHDRNHARRLLGGSGVETGHLPFGNCAQDQHAVRDVGELVLSRVLRSAGDLEPAVHPVERLADCFICILHERVLFNPARWTLRSAAAVAVSLSVGISGIGGSGLEVIPPIGGGRRGSLLARGTGGRTKRSRRAPPAAPRNKTPPRPPPRRSTGRRKASYSSNRFA